MEERRRRRRRRRVVVVTVVASCHHVDVLLRIVDANLWIDSEGFPEKTKN
jgi:hypothetical protein